MTPNPYKINHLRVSTWDLTSTSYRSLMLLKSLLDGLPVDSASAETATEIWVKNEITHRVEAQGSPAYIYQYIQSAKVDVIVASLPHFEMQGSNLVLVVDGIYYDAAHYLITGLWAVGKSFKIRPEKINWWLMHELPKQIAASTIPPTTPL
jgi:hypothetical protein